MELAIRNRISEQEEILKNEVVISKLQKSELMIAGLSVGSPISQYEEKTLVDMVGTIAKGIIRDIGIKSPDLTYEVYRFLEILKKYYSGLTISEVKTAFELSMVGALDEYLPKDKNGQPDRNHYQSFSLEYITKILRAFQAHKNKVWRKALIALPAPEKVMTADEIEEAFQGVRNDIEEKFLEFKNTGVMPEFLAPSLVVKELHRNGTIIEICPVSDADIRKSLFILNLSNNLSDLEKSEIRKRFDSGTIHPRHNIEAERIRDLNLIRKTFEEITELKF